MHQPTPNPFGDFPYQSAGPEEIVRAELVPEDKTDPGERISILYLMVWTAGSAVILAFYRQAMTLTTTSAPPTWLQAVTGIAGAPIQGACVASLLLVLWRRFKGGRPFPKEPGHWLLVIPGITTLMSWSLWLIVRQLMERRIYTFVIFYRLPVLVIFSILAVFVITKLRAEPKWRAMFVVWLAANYTTFFLSCLGGVGVSSIEPVINGFISLAFLIPTLLDLRDRRRRDHLHYAGVAARIGNAGMSAIQCLTMYLR